jgi:hypothetical protein
MPNSRIPATDYGFGAPGDQAGGRVAYRQQQSAQNNSLANEIKQQPLPYNQTPEYQQMQQLINQQATQLGTYGSQVAGMQQQLTRLSAADPTKLAIRQMMALYGQDPLAAYRSQMMRQANPIQQMNWAVPMYGFESTWSG